MDAKDGIINLGDTFADEIGFTSDKFSGWLWRDGERVLISFIESTHPGEGNLSHLFDAIEARNLRVAVPIPFAHMRAILERKGFVPHAEHRPDGVVDVWERGNGA